MSEDEIREALREYRRWLLETMGRDLVAALSERRELSHAHEVRAACLREVNALLYRDDLIRAAAERMKVEMKP